MYMNEFVKRLYDFWVFIEFFGVKIVITNIYRYLPIFIDILLIFFQKFQHKRVLYSRDFLVEKSVFSDFSTKNRRFYWFFHGFSFDRFFHCFFFSVPAENRFFDDISVENRFFGDISAEKTDFFIPIYNKIL